MNRLRCRSVNHEGMEHTIGAVVARCVRCRKPTCSDCEGTDDGLRDLCDNCAVRIHGRIDVLRDREDFADARRLVRTWAARGRFREVIEDHDLDLASPGTPGAKETP